MAFHFLQNFEHHRIVSIGCNNKWSLLFSNLFAVISLGFCHKVIFHITCCKYFNSISKKLCRNIFFAYLQTFNEAVFTFRLVWSLGLSKIENFCLEALFEELVTWIGPATNWVGIEVAVLPPVKSRLLCERSMMIEFRHRHFLMLPMSSNSMLPWSNQGFTNQILLRLGLFLFLHKGSTVRGFIHYELLMMSQKEAPMCAS